MPLPRSQSLSGLHWAGFAYRNLDDLDGKDQEAYGIVNKSGKGSQKEREGVVSEEKPTHFTDAAPEAQRRNGGANYKCGFCDSALSPDPLSGGPWNLMGEGALPLHCLTSSAVESR